MKLPLRFIPFKDPSDNVKPIIVDALASGKGMRRSTQDVIGAGPRTVAGVLEKKGLEPIILPVEAFLDERFSSKKYDFLLVSGMTSDIPAIQRTVKKWRKNVLGPVVLGGPAASEPERLLRKTGGDIAVTGEGEESIDKLLDGGLYNGEIPDNLEEVLGISYRRNKKIVVNPFKPVQLKKVFYDFFPSTESIKGYRLFESARVYVEVVRGCSNYHRARIGSIGRSCSFCEQCTESGLYERYDCPVGIPPGCGYCSVPSLYGPPKSRPSDLIIDEVSRLLELGVHRVVLSAPGFLDYEREAFVEPLPLTDPRSPEPNYDEIEVLLDGLYELPKLMEGDASVMIENVKASLVTERAARLLGKYLGGSPVSVGFETGMDEHSKVLGRPDTPLETLVSLRRLKEAGMKPTVYFIHGLPGQSSDTVDETIHMIKKSMRYGADHVILYRFQSLPLSTFSESPSGLPVSQDPLSKRIYVAAQEANLNSKEALIGDRVRVVIAERYDRDRRFFVAYPMLHGPVTLIQGEDFDSGDVITVRVSGISSERMVYGDVIEPKN
ncbi:B12-binding domain-containing radical SAM protein [Thermoproteota archaeon]